jgi:16S rRNA (cytosine1402-N4)-methyltransferase
MLDECCHYLNIRPNHLYLDCTLGGGGHTLAILQRGGKVIALDQDSDSINKIQQDPLMAQYLQNNQLEIHQNNFSNLKNIISHSKLCQEFNSPPAVHGVLFDLGISSHQIDNVSRGFTYRYDESPLDMRMSQHNPQPQESSFPSLTASELVNQVSTQELANLLYTYGDERRSRQIATAIVSTRPHHTSATLRAAIESVTRPADHIKTLSRCYQALRIVVNHEMDCLHRALESLHEVVFPSGRLVVLSYHSLEDRIMKQFLRKERIKKKTTKYQRTIVDDDDLDHEGDEQEIEEEEGSKEMNTVESLLEGSKVHWKALQSGVIKPSKEEIQRNNRARSAKLRVGERL